MNDSFKNPFNSYSSLPRSGFTILYHHSLFPKIFIVFIKVTAVLVQLKLFAFPQLLTFRLFHFTVVLCLSRVFTCVSHYISTIVLSCCATFFSPPLYTVLTSHIVRERPPVVTTRLSIRVSNCHSIYVVHTQTHLRRY